MPEDISPNIKNSRLTSADDADSLLVKKLKRSAFRKLTSLNHLDHARSELLQGNTHERILDVDAQLRRLERTTDCFSILAYRQYYEISQDWILHSANLCKNHLACPNCAALRAVRKARDMHDKVSFLANANPELDVYFLVLTVKNGHDLGERYDHLMRSLRTLTKRTRDAKQAMKCANPSKSKYAYAMRSQFSHVEGLAYSVELTYSSEHGWHPHANLIFLSPKRISVRTLRQEWKQITGDSHVFKLAKIDPNSAQGTKAFFEVWKYALKFGHLPERQWYEAYVSLQKKRLIATTGKLRGLETEPEELLPEKLEIYEPYIERLYTYLDKKYTLT